MATVVNVVGKDRKFDILAIKHPLYSTSTRLWRKWRLTLEGGYDYLKKYLYRFVDTEDVEDFKRRLNISYIPAFAKNGVLEIKNSIYQRMTDISRVGGTITYQQAVVGRENGVDLMGSSMNTFVGLEVLPELLFMSRVGIYVDMPPKLGPTMADNVGIRPYLYIYGVEDIISWAYDKDPNSNTFSALLLRDHDYDYESETGLPKGEVDRYRFYRRTLDGVVVRFFDANGIEDRPQMVLEIPEIPFVMPDLTMSLLSEIDDYQIALMNLASADMQYCRNANFPFYTEQYDMRFEAPHLRGPEEQSAGDPATTGVNSEAKTVKVGSRTGRRYPKGTDRPGFIHPSSEPIQASMAKQEQLKREIRTLLHLSLSALGQKMASAESKEADQTPLESGLSYIGLVLQDAEQQIARYWSMYEGSKDIATVKYPTKYSLKTDAERFSEADKLESKLATVPSNTYKKEIGKKIAKILLGPTISEETLKKIDQEIDKALIAVIKPELVDKHVTAGILAPDYAAQAMGYPDDSVQKAQQFQAERLAQIRASQTAGKEGEEKLNAGARGVPDESVNPTEEARIEKEGLKKEKIAANEGKSISNEDKGEPPPIGD